MELVTILISVRVRWLKTRQGFSSYINRGSYLHYLYVRIKTACCAHNRDDTNNNTPKHNHRRLQWLLPRCRMMVDNLIRPLGGGGRETAVMCGGCRGQRGASKTSRPRAKWRGKGESGKRISSISRRSSSSARGRTIIESQWPTTLAAHIACACAAPAEAALAAASAIRGLGSASSMETGACHRRWNTAVGLLLDLLLN